MAHLIFWCHAANRVIMTGVQIEFTDFKRLHVKRTVICRFCGLEHEWELVEKVPEASALMSLRAEDFLGRSIENATFAVKATDPGIRVEHEEKAGLLAS